MGYITVFTDKDCPRSKRVKRALTARMIPFNEISITKYPEKRQDLFILLNSFSLPQVFFNTAHIGGSKETINFLKRKWDNRSLYSSGPAEAFLVEVALSPDPTIPLLMLPSRQAQQKQSRIRSRSSSTVISSRITAMHGRRKNGCGSSNFGFTQQDDDSSSTCSEVFFDEDTVEDVEDESVVFSLSYRG